MRRHFIINENLPFPGSIPAAEAMIVLDAKGKEARTIRYNRGGGHYLFIRVDYWWCDLRTFLLEKLL